MEQVMAAISFISELTFTSWIGLIVIFLIAFHYVATSPWKRLPPGPWCLPFVGSIPSIGRDTLNGLKRNVAKYGNICTIYLGSHRCVVLSGYDVIKEAATGKYAAEFAGRPRGTVAFSEYFDDGIANEVGHAFQEQKNFVLTNFGAGEDAINAEIVHCLAAFKNRKRNAFSPGLTIGKCVANTINSILFDRRFDYEDPEFDAQMKLFFRNFRELGVNNPASVLRYLRYLPGDLFGIKRIFNAKDKMLYKFQTWVKECEERSDKRTTDPKAFVTRYMSHVKKGEHHSFTERRLLRIVYEMLQGGVDKISATITWALLYITIHGDIQTQVQREIDRVVLSGKKCISYEDRHQMPYTEAVISEVHRLADVAPLVAPHATTADVPFLGYNIPKDTLVLLNVRSVHMDPTLWPDPEKFDPGRFLDGRGKYTPKETVLPFSIGLRICPAERLSRMEIFLILTALLQRFSFRLPRGAKPNTEAIVGVTRWPADFELVAENR